MTSTSSRPGSSKPSTPARGANGGNTGHSSLILRKQLLGKSSESARIIIVRHGTGEKGNEIAYGEIAGTFADV